jgi:hypothetical protein
MNGHLIWLLLRHEFRLRQRERTTSLWYTAQGFLFLYFIGFMILWASNNQKTIQWFNPLPETFPIIAGGIINLYLILFSTAHKRNYCQNFGNDPFRENLYAAPISSRIILESHLLNTITLGALTSIGLLPIWIFLTVFYNTPIFIISLPLVTIFAITCQESLSLWKKYIHETWFRDNLTKTLFKTFEFLILYCPFVFIFVTAFLTNSHILSTETINQWLHSTEPFWKTLFKGLVSILLLLMANCWLWGRATLLDPLPTIFLLLSSIGLVWLTVNMVHRPLLTAIQTPITESKPQKTWHKLVKFQSNQTYLLIQREWRRHRVPPFTRFLQLIAIFIFPYLTVLSSPFVKHPGGSLAYGIVLIPAYAAFVNAWIIFGTEDSLTLLQSAPVSMRWVGWCKRLALLIPLWILFLPIIIIAGLIGGSWGWILFFAFVVPLSQVILRSWNTLPASVASQEIPLHSAKTTDFGRDLLLAFCELFSCFIWATCLILMLEGQTLWGLFALGIEACLMALAYRRNLQIGDIWGI